MAVHVNRHEAYDRAVWALGRMGLPQPWADWGHRAPNQEEGDTNDCAWFVTWLLKDNGGYARSDLRNGSIKELRKDRKWHEFTENAHHFDPKAEHVRMGALICLEWEVDATQPDSIIPAPDHIGFVTSVNRRPDRTPISFNTIEANTGPRVGVHTPCGVYRRTRFFENIVTFIQPPYLPDPK